MAAVLGNRRIAAASSGVCYASEDRGLSAQPARGEAGGSRGLRAGGGGGPSDGMDARVARLEAHVEILRSDGAAMRVDIADIRTNLATLTERVTHMPTKGFVLSANVSLFGFFSAVMVFSEKLKALAGL